MADTDEWVRVINPAGELVEIPRSRLFDAKDRGYLTEEEASQKAVEDDYGGGIAQGIAGVSSALRGASLGVTDAITAGTVGAYNALTGGGAVGDGGPQLSEKYRKLAEERGLEVPEADTRGAFARGYDAAQQYLALARQANPVTSTTAEVGGAIAGTLLTGGAAPAGAVAKLGTGAAGVAERLGGGAIAKGLTAGVIEGGLSAASLAASSLTSEQIADPGLAAEQIWASAKSGMLLGGAVGGGLGAAAVGAKALAGGARKVADYLRPSPAVVAEPIEDFVGATQGLAARPLSSALPELPRGKMQSITDSVQMANGGFDDVVAGATPKINDAYNRLIQSSDNIDAFAGVAQKNQANKLLNGQQIGARIEDVEALVRDMTAEIDGFTMGMSEQALSSGGGLLALKRTKKLLEETLDLSRQDFAQGRYGEAFTKLDQAKRSIGQYATGTKSPVVEEFLGNQYPKIQQLLEDESKWLGSATNQRMINGPWSESIRKSKDAAAKRFVTRGAEVSQRGFGRQMDRANDEAIRNWLRGDFAAPGLSATEKAWRESLVAKLQDATTRANVLGGKALQGEAKSMAESVRTIFDELDRVAYAKRDAIRGGAIMQQSSAEAVLGAVPGLGRATGAIAGAKRLGVSLASSGQQAARRTAEAADSLMSRIGPAAEKASTRAGVVAGTLAAPKPIADKEYFSALRESLALQRAGSPEAQELFRAGAEMEQEDPVAAESYVATAIKRAAYITAKMPKPDLSTVYPEPPTLDPASEASLKRTVDAAYKPLEAMERVAKLAHSREDLEALKTLFPKMFASFKSQVEQRMRSPAGQKKRPTYAQRVELSLALDMPLDRSMQPQMLSALQAGAAEPMVAEVGEGPQVQQQAQQRTRNATPRLGGLDKRDDVYASPVDRILDQR